MLPGVTYVSVVGPSVSWEGSLWLTSFHHFLQHSLSWLVTGHPFLHPWLTQQSTLIALP